MRPLPPRRLRRRRLRQASSVAAIAALIFASRVASALPPPIARAGGQPGASAALSANGAAPPASSARTVEIRLSISTFALRTLAEARVRRLVEIETEDVAVLAPGASGPLGDHVAFVWVDQPTISKVVVEVRVGDRAVERREIAVRGLAADVVSRLVAIAISEMVRAGMVPRPPPPPPPPEPLKPTAEEIERAARLAPAVMLAPEVAFTGLPAAGGAMGGAGVSVGFRYFGAGESIFGRLLAGRAGGSSVRWLEVGLGLDYRISLNRSLRLALGGQAAFASVHVGDALSIAGEIDQRESWSARAGGLAAIEGKVGPGIWLGLELTPGAILRPVRFTDVGTRPGVIEGVWLGAAFTARFERVRAPSP